MRDDFICTTTTVPERAEAIKEISREMIKKGIPQVFYMDEEHNGNLWNMQRMFIDLCLDKKFQGKNIITTTDDIVFLDGWLNKVEYLLKNTDYDIITLFTNLKYKPDDGFVKRACHNWWLYDVCIVFRAGVLTPKFYDGFAEHCRAENLHKFELNHFDQRLSRYTYTAGYKCGIVRPNCVELQDIKSVIGHSIKDCNKERGK